LNTVVTTNAAENWLRELIDDALDDDAAMLAVMQLARRTHDRWRDVSDDARKRALNWLDRRGAPERLKILVDEGGELDSAEQGQIFGESLPVGLSVRPEES
ncbi:MAG TPA: molecular chaperone DnaK, partial [Pirellulales bacterium]